MVEKWSAAYAKTDKSKVGKPVSSILLLFLLWLLENLLATPDWLENSTIRSFTILTILIFSLARLHVLIDSYNK